MLRLPLNLSKAMSSVPAPAIESTLQPSSRRLGDLLVERQLATRADIGKALAFQQQFGGRIGSILVRLGALSEESLLPVLSGQLGMPLLEGAEWPADAAALHDVAHDSGLVPDWWVDNGVAGWKSPEGGVLVVARDPLDPTLDEILGRRLASGWQWRLARTQDIDRLLDLAARAERPGDEAGDDDVSHLRELAEEAPVIELVNNVLAQAMDQRASDIHIEPEDQVFHVRLRVDGILHTRLTLPMSRYPAVASRVKLISGMDIAERRLPQDGRLSTRVSGQEVDIRASSVPAVHGESLVLRLLPKERQDLSLERLGFTPRDLGMFRGWAREPHGIVLVTGPTGSGKSTTLYGTLEEMNQRDRKIITVEDPVEYQVKGVTQIQANAEIGYNFARALRAILRQDPDVIMIGEIRDLETAEIAVQSALTGHLVLSTLHTNNAAGGITRMMDMGVEDYLLTSTVNGILAQRLVRRIEPTHAEKYEALPEVIEEFGLRRFQPEGTIYLYRPKPSALTPTGYLGRTTIMEFLVMDDELRRMVMQHAGMGELEDAARARGMRTMYEDGLLKAMQGLTTIEEVLRVTQEA